jgi:peroxiredoxin
VKKPLLGVLLVAVALLAAAGGVVLQRYLSSSAPTPETPPVGAPGPARNAITSNVTSQPRPDFQLPDVSGKSRSASEWDGQVVLVNFWATWCPPCVEEMPALNELYGAYKDKGFTIVGIALDTDDDVQAFIDPMDIAYPILIGDETGVTLSQAYGNRLGLLPFSVFVGRDGRIARVHPGEIEYEQAESILKELL